MFVKDCTTKYTLWQKQMDPTTEYLNKTHEQYLSYFF